MRGSTGHIRGPRPSRRATVTGGEDASEVQEKEVTAIELDDAGAPHRVNEYAIGAELGRGAFARVYRGSKDGELFAIKVFNKSLLKRKQEFKRVGGRMVATNAFQKVQKEVAIMKKLRHPNLTRLYEVIDSPEDDKLFLVLDLIAGGQLLLFDAKAQRYSYTRDGGAPSPGPVTPVDVIQDCLVDVAWGLDYLHRNLICHRDIKPENILVTEDEQYVLGDFGVAHMFSETDAELSLKSTEGTYHFLAPECTTGEPFDPFKVDVWALGVTLFAMVFGTTPFGASAATPAEVLTAVRSDPLVFPNAVDPELQDLLERLLDKAPTSRLSISGLLVHPWLTASVVAAAKAPNVTDAIDVSGDEIAVAFTRNNKMLLLTLLKLKLNAKLRRARASLAERAKADETAAPTRPADDLPKPRRSSRQVSDVAIETRSPVGDPTCRLM
ncbi:protein kinase [Achlya hypogyna]|uniref:Protein kinase n=1 Tax=Achlya hypogyna TaxID=1202772 RepID=A0A1V9YYW3_ACHHY|nr:protein kinase [Achlya hypogyna]